MHIEINLAEMLALVVSQENSCRYCFAAHRLLSRFAGMSETHLRRLEHDLLTSVLPKREQRAIAFARRLSRSTPILALADLAPLIANGWSDMAIREMALVCGARPGPPGLPPRARLPDSPRKPQSIDPEGTGLPQARAGTVSMDC